MKKDELIDGKTLALRVGLLLAKDIKLALPVKTGRARNSVVVKETLNGVVVGSNLDYMQFIEEDTKPHIIKPKNKKALFWPGAEHPVKFVNHPGTKGKYIFQKIAQDKNLIAKYIKQSLP